MKEVVIYRGEHYTWGWDEEPGRVPQLALKLTEAGAEVLKVFGDRPTQVHMTVEPGTPERITVRG